MENSKEPVLPPIILTKREYFASMALQGFISSIPAQTYEFLVSRSIKAADELLKQLEQKK